MSNNQQPIMKLKMEIALYEDDKEVVVIKGELHGEDKFLEPELVAAGYTKMMFEAIKDITTS